MRQRTWTGSLPPYTSSAFSQSRLKSWEILFSRSSIRMSNGELLSSSRTSMALINSVLLLYRGLIVNGPNSNQETATWLFSGSHTGAPQTSLLLKHRNGVFELLVIFPDFHGVDPMRVEKFCPLPGPHSGYTQSARNTTKSLLCRNLRLWYWRSALLPASKCPFQVDIGKGVIVHTFLKLMVLRTLIRYGS